MPQIFQVLRCYKCMVFQVHQTKKSNKWECKICGEKQSIKRHYGLGSGKECRIHVQKLNGVRGEIDELNESNTSTDEKFDSEIQNVVSNNTKIESKWSEFVEKTEEITKSDHNQRMYLDNLEVVLEVPSECKKFCGKINLKNKSKLISPLQQNKAGKENDLQAKVSNEINNANKFGKAALNKLDLLENTVMLDLEPNISMGKKQNKCVIEKCEQQRVSKWAQFTDDSKDPIKGDDLSEDKENALKKSRCTFFSICDDNDLDDVLNI